MNSERIIATIPKSRRNAVRVTLGERDHRPCVDIRQFEPNGKRELMPTQKGVVIAATMIPDLIAALQATLMEQGS
jgi:hypothetical protein